MSYITKDYYSYYYYCYHFNFSYKQTGSYKHILHLKHLALKNRCKYLKKNKNSYNVV